MTTIHFQGRTITVDDRETEQRLQTPRVHRFIPVEDLATKQAEIKQRKAPEKDSALDEN